MGITRKIAEMHQGRVIAVEPNITTLSNEDFELITLEQAHLAAHIALLLVDHKEFKVVKSIQAVIVDTKGIWCE